MNYPVQSALKLKETEIEYFISIALLGVQLIAGEYSVSLSFFTHSHIIVEISVYHLINLKFT